MTFGAPGMEFDMMCHNGPCDGCLINFKLWSLKLENPIKPFNNPLKYSYHLTKAC